MSGARDARAMAFCVECGRAGPTLEGLCEDDFRTRHKPVRGPEQIDVERCAHCGKLRIGGRWEDRVLQEALPEIVAEMSVRDRHVTDARFMYDMRAEDSRNFALTVKAACAVGPWEIADSFDTRLRLHEGQCPTCSRQKGKFFVGTVQIRADGRDLTPAETDRAHTIVDRSPSGAEFVSEIRSVRGGFDVKVSSNPFARRLARHLAKELGGAAVTSSATLHTQREGRDQYRVTYLVRLAAFREGDVVLWRRARYRVVAMGDPVRLKHAETGEMMRVRPRELRTARVVAK